MIPSGACVDQLQVSHHASWRKLEMKHLHLFAEPRSTTVLFFLLFKNLEKHSRDIFVVEKKLYQVKIKVERSVEEWMKELCSFMCKNTHTWQYYALKSLWRLFLTKYYIFLQVPAYEMSENSEKRQSVFLKTQDNVLRCLVLSPQPKDIQFTVTEEERNQQIFTFKKLESQNFD